VQRRVPSTRWCSLRQPGMSLSRRLAASEVHCRRCTSALFKWLCNALPQAGLLCCAAHTLLVGSSVWLAAPLPTFPAAGQCACTHQTTRQAWSGQPKEAAATESRFDENSAASPSARSTALPSPLPLATAAREPSAGARGKGIVATGDSHRRDQLSRQSWPSRHLTCSCLDVV